MEVKKEVDDSNEVENEYTNPEEDRDRKLPPWMLTSDETPTQNEESARSPNPDEDKEETTVTTAGATADGTLEDMRVACKYGDSCYRRNPAHKNKFSHPGDDDYTAFQEDESSQENNDNKPECQYGTSCYRQNPQHKRDFKHTQQPDTSKDTPEKKKPAKRPRRSDSDYESEGDKDYDLEDSFIDDAHAEEEDEDYVPDNINNHEVDPELLKEDQWRPSSDDAPEVLELLKEARDYLRNKKLHK